MNMKIESVIDDRGTRMTRWGCFPLGRIRRYRLLTTVCALIFSFTVLSHIWALWGFTTLFNKTSKRFLSDDVPKNSVNVYLNFKSTRRLSPLASVTQRIAFADPPLTKTQISEIYRTGAGLEKIEVEGIPTWREFGVTYVPHQLKKYAESNLSDTFHSDYDPYIAYNHTMFFEGRDHEKVPDSQRKIILTLTAGVHDIEDPHPIKVCPEFPCVQTTHYTKYLSNASAVTFNGFRMLGNAPMQRNPDQVYIFYNFEPFDPIWSRNLVFRKKEAGWHTVFNWTMSYHLDADIFMPYALIRKRPIPIVRDYSAILVKKERMVAIFASHCPSFGKREMYVKELQKYIPVDVYGQCGPYKCIRDKDTECFKNVSQKYKFYLAFENALCEDYITEKFFKNLQTDLVLVARGGNAYYKHMPEEIFINTADFDSPKALAERLKYLDSHDEEYVKLLKRKDQYFAAYEEYPHIEKGEMWYKYNWENAPVCEICQRLWNIDLYGKTYSDIEKWYDERICREPSDI